MLGRPGCQQRCSHNLPTLTYRTCLLPNVPLGHQEASSAPRAAILRWGLAEQLPGMVQVGQEGLGMVPES